MKIMRRNFSDFAKKAFLLALSVLFLISCGNTIEVSSPNGELSVSLTQDNENVLLSVAYKGDTLIAPSPIGFIFEDSTFGKDVKMKKGKQERVIDEYDMPVGKASHIYSESNQCIVSLTSTDGRQVDVCLRAFNDAVAFRYIFPKPEGVEKLQIKREVMELHPKGDPILKAMYLPNVDCSHESNYTTCKLSEHNVGKTADMPVLFSYDNGHFLALTEAMALDYAGMQLNIKDNIVSGQLTPRKDNPELCVIADFPHKSPWRVFLVSDRVGALMESTVVTTLCDPCKETDISWIKPGKSTWMWWNGYQTSPEAKKGDLNTINFNINKEYIDFCAENGIQYHSIMGILKPNGQEVVWYYSSQDSDPARASSDDSTVKTYPGFDLNAICDYARQKGIDMRAWVHWHPLSKDIENTFKKFHDMGIKGLMVDYMDRDDQEMVDFEKQVLEAAMKYHLDIQFHGARKPSGLQRTYPCEFTRENALNYEVYKWDNERRMGADHDISIPFTRGLAGPTDYHLGGFVSVPNNEYHVDFLKPNVTSTRCHMLGMYVVLESALHLVADAPINYKDQPGFEFIRDIPTVWDESRVPQAVMDEYVVTARRKGSNWYVGSIGNSKERDIELSFDFLDDGEYNMELYTDAADTDTNPNNLQKNVKPVVKTDVMKIHLQKSGGFAARIVKKI